MSSRYRFQGFSPAGLDFYPRLAANNDRQWFTEHKELYEREVLTPARDLVEDLGLALAPAAPGLHADARVNRSLFRIQRDVRFSADKSPYKTHLGIWLWEGDGPRMDCSGFYFHLEPPRLMLAAGMHMFPKHLLGPFRQDAADAKLGPALVKALNPGLKQGLYQVGGQHYVRVPRGFPPDHPRADLLKHNGLYVFHDAGMIDELRSPALVDWCAQRLLAMVPVHRWLLELTKRHGADAADKAWPV
jgi:uncharacterized protein (TIGR02453 family)